MERLDKILSDSGIGTRKELKKIIADGRVFVNGFPARKPETKLDRSTSEITVDGKQINIAKYRYFAMNKPSGVLTATEDRNQSTVLDLLRPEDRNLGLFPVGRLDKDTTGLLLLTNDGDFAHRVISPAVGVEKRYNAETDGSVTDADIVAFASGLVLKDGTVCQNAKLEYLGENRCAVTISEGKYHQVKRMLASVGKPVLKLHRESVGALVLPDQLDEGSYYELESCDIALVFSTK